MLRITASVGNGAASYFNAELSRGDYYAGKGDVAGRWHGNAAALLGLEGDVTREQFVALVSNRHPETGEQLTPRQRDDRRSGYDFTFSVPKSVSAFYEYLQASGRSEQAAVLLDGFKGAVRATMAELEADMRVRVRAGGQSGDRVTGNLVWAEFVHFQSRPVDGVADPHLHSHAYALNLTHDGKGWKAGEFGSIKRDATYYQEAFHARMGRALESLGYAVETRGKGFELVGVERATIAKFSRRTAEVERAAEKLGVTSDKLKEKLGARTRANKDEGLSPEATRAAFLERLDDRERAVFARIAGGGDAPPHAPEPTQGAEHDREAAALAVDFALAHSFERASALPEKRVLAEALRVGVGHVTPEEVGRALAERSDVVRAELGGQGMLTTSDVLKEEAAMLRFAKSGKAQQLPLAGFRSHVEKGLREPYAFQRAWLSDEQKEAVLHVIHNTDTVVGIRGGAGTGKTAMLQEAVEAVGNLTGKAPVVLAPSAQASRGVLREEGFQNADTVARFLQDKEMQQQAKGGVIFVDEAGLLGSRTMHALFQVAKAQNARVVLQGDVGQHASVERGDALRLLEERGGVAFAELTTIRRQRPKAYREAIGAIAKGDVRGGFAALDAMGAIVEVKDGTLHAQAARAYLDATARGESALVVSPTHAEGASVTASIRDALKASGKLGEARDILQLHATGWTEAERGRAESYSPGQVVTFHRRATGFRPGERATVEAIEDGRVLVTTQSGERRTLPLAAAKSFQVFEARTMELAVGDVVRATQNSRDVAGACINNGSVYRVEGFRSDGGVVLLDGNGKQKEVRADFGHISHAYCATSHSAQGRTVDRVFVAQSAESLAASSREQFYVSASRGRLSVQVFTDSKAELQSAIERSGQRMSAGDVAAGAKQTAQPEQETMRKRVKAFQRKVLERARNALVARWREEEREWEPPPPILQGWPAHAPERGFERG
ncbi:MAG: MobF family relaxase [Polyangiaceae bacterium]